MSFQIGSSDAAMLSLSATDSPHGTYLVEIRARGLSASAEVAIGKDRLHQYFVDLAAEWRGWEGRRLFTAHRPEVDYGPPVLTIAATSNESGHVRFEVSMGEHDPDWSVPTEWVVQCIVAADAGQLDAIAAKAAALPVDFDGHW